MSHRPSLLLLFVLLVVAPPLHARPLTADEEELFDTADDLQFDAGIALADRIIGVAPDAVFPHRARIFCFLFDHSRDPKPEIDAYRERLKTDPLDLVAGYVVVYAELVLAMNLPDAQARKKEYERLRDRARQMVAARPDDADAQTLLSRCLISTGADREGAKAIARAIALDPENVALRISLMTYTLEGAPREENRRWLDAWAKAHPESPLAPQVWLRQVAEIPTDAQRALALEALLPKVLGTRVEDDVRMSLVHLDRQAGEHLEKIVRRGFCNQYVGALKRQAERIRSVEGTWSWFSTQEQRVPSQRQALDFLVKVEKTFTVIPGELLAQRARVHYLLEEYPEARASLARIKDLGSREARTYADSLYLEAASWYAQGEYEEARESYDRILEGNHLFPMSGRFRHLECMVRQYPLMAVAQGSTLFLMFLGILLSVALIAAQIRFARRYFPLAAAVALLVTALELFLFCTTSAASIAGILMVLVLGFFKNSALIAAGMLLAARGGVRPLATLRDLGKILRGRPPTAWGRGAAIQAFAILGCWLGVLVMTGAMFLAVRPQANEAVNVARSFSSSSDREREKIEAATEGRPAAPEKEKGPPPPPVSEAAMIALLVTAAAVEEILFRWFLLGFFQAYLRRWRWSVEFAIILTAFLWGLGHLGAVDPWWFRLVHTTGAGVVFGWLRWRWGVESSFAAHSLYNLAQNWMPRFVGWLLS